jgi:F0F1-type ATP synthase membrane subunit b/b'
MPASTQPRDFQSELKAAQSAVKTLATRREQLVGDARVEESRVKAAIEALQGLEVPNPHKLTVVQLQALKETSGKNLEKHLDTLKTQIADAQALMAEYDSVSKQ